MSFRTRLTLFFLAVVVGPVVAAAIGVQNVAERGALARADAELRGASMGVRQALEEQSAEVRRGLDDRTAARAFTAKSDELARIREEARLDYLVVVRNGRVSRSSMRTPSFSSGIHVTAGSLTRSDLDGVAVGRRVRIVGRPGSAVFGGVFRDSRFLGRLPSPAVTVSGGGVMATSQGIPAMGNVTGTGPFDTGDSMRGLCVCSNGDGVAILVRVDHARFSGSLVLLLVVGLGAATGLAYLLAFVVARPLQRLARRASSLASDTSEPPVDSGGSREIAELGEAFDGMTMQLRKTKGELAESERRSLTDQLTGVWNRRYLERTLHEEANRGARFGHSFSILVIDIDHFKAVNDAFGHERGDVVLVEVCRRTALALRDDLDTVARLGGEEFAVILPETTRQGAFVVAEKIREAIKKEPFPGDLQLTVSIGVAAFPYDGEDGPELLRAGDAALYEAKRSGRDRVVLAVGLPTA